MLLRIELKPLEPYFFGNERNLKYEGVTQQNEATYFIKSEKTPLQSTLFGALRYMGIKEKHADFSLSEEDYANIGKESFQLGTVLQSFGRIKKISNLYLVDGEGKIYIKAPADQPSFDDEKVHEYQGVERFRDKVETQNGPRYFPQINMKEGFFDGYVRAEDQVCVPSKDIFTTIVRTGLNTKEKEKALFKKEYCFMKEYAFMFYADVEDDFPEITDRVVNLGQGKTAFAVKVKNIDDMGEAAFDVSSPFPVEAVKVVLLSESYVRDVKALYSCCYFSRTDVREYRAMRTDYAAQKQIQRYKKQETLLRLLKAGSVFWVNPEKIDDFRKLIDDEQAQLAGFNCYTTGGNK